MKFRVRYKFKKAGPGRPKEGTLPKRKSPSASSDQVRDKICCLIEIERREEDKGKPFRKWELIQLMNYIVLTMDIVRGKEEGIEL